MEFILEFLNLDSTLGDLNIPMHLMRYDHVTYLT